MNKEKIFSGRVPVTFKIERIRFRQLSDVILKSEDGSVYKFVIPVDEGILCSLYAGQAIEEKSLDPFEKEPAKDFEVLDFFVRSYQTMSGVSFIQVNICRDDLGHLCAMLIDEIGNKYKMAPGAGLLLASQNNKIELTVEQKLFDEKEGVAYGKRKPIDLWLGEN